MFPGGGAITEFPVGTGTVGGTSLSSNAPFTPSPSLSAPRAPSIQGGYSTVPNLLLTTLAVFAVGSQLVKREATLHNAKPAPAVQVFQVPNLLTSTLGNQVIPIPIGNQQVDSAPQTPQIGSWQPNRNPLLFTLPLPVGRDQTESAPPSVPIGASQQTQSRLLLEQIVQPLPIGRQQVESAPRASHVLFWDRGTNTLLFTTTPIGKQETESAPPSQSINQAQETQSRALLDFQIQPIPVGKQSTDNRVQTPEVEVFTPPQIQPPVVAEQPIPIGKQQTDSSPPTPRIGGIKFARGVDPGPPVTVNPIPIGVQRTESQVRTPEVDSFRSPTIIPPIVAAQEIPIGKQSILPVPYRQERPKIDQPANLLGSAIGLPPIASANIEWTQRLGPPPVFLWLPENVTIRIPVVAQELPPGEQRVETQITTPAVQVFTPPQIIPPIVQAVPIGRQQTDSAPIPAPTVQSFTAPVIIPPVIVPIPPGQQRTDSAPPFPPQVQGYEAPNATLFIPPPGTLPIGRQQSESAPIWAVPIGTAVGWTTPPDLLPPDTRPPVVATSDVTGGWPMYYGKRIRRQPVVTEIVTPEQIQEEIQQAKSRLEQKRELRRAERRSRYVTEQIRGILEEQDRLKLSLEALKLQLQIQGMNDDDIALILALAS